MKWLLAILILFFTIPVFSQANELASLSNRLTADHSTEREKVKSIFKWITANISYRIKPDPRKIIGINSRRNYKSEIEDDDDNPLKPLNERVAENVFRRKVAVCDGFARLFTTLCDYAGIRSEIVVGYARVGTNHKDRFGVNHYWNAVMIDSQWHLLDVTWASGYLNSKGDEFIPAYDEQYFLTPPEIFIEDHYPDDARWTLLPGSKMPDEFRRSPFKLKSFTKYRFTNIYPSAGVIETFVGDTLRLKLETAISEQGRDVCPDLLIDSAIFTHSPSWVFVKPQASRASDEHHYVYPVASEEVEWLYLVYNDDLVLR